MKLKKIIIAFNQVNEKEIPLIIKVSKSIKDFSRKMDLLSSIKELKEINEEYRKEEQAIIKELVQRYCDEQNKGKKEGLLTPDKILRVPPNLYPEYLKKINELLDSEINIKYPFRFNKEEIKNSGIDIDEIIKLEDFTDLTDKKDKNKS